MFNFVRLSISRNSDHPSGFPRFLCDVRNVTFAFGASELRELNLFGFVFDYLFLVSERDLINLFFFFFCFCALFFVLFGWVIL